MAETTEKSLETRKVVELKNYEHNSRTHSDAQVDQLVKSIQEFGFNNPILVDENDVIIAGHGRLMAAQKAGLEEVPTIKLSHLSENQKRAYIIADNKIADNAGWDEDMLKAEMLALKDEDFDLEPLGFSHEELDAMLPDIKEPMSEDEAAAEAERENEIPETQENELGVQIGELYHLGNHRLLCGDATNKEDVERLMDGQKADMVYTDPPYGISFSNKSLPKNDYVNVREGLNHNYFEVLKNDDKPFDPSHLLNIQCKEMFIWGAINFPQNLPISTWVVWDRKLNESADKALAGDFDLCWSKNKHKMAMCRIPWYGVFGHSKTDDGSKKQHPTQKPVKLAEWFFDRWGKDKTNIVDLYLGSGSTLIACEKTNRKCFGMEISEHYVSVAIKRWEKYTGQKAVKIQ